MTLANGNPGCSKKACSESVKLKWDAQRRGGIKAKTKPSLVIVGTETREGI
jgi:hypothetical protein